MTGTNMLKLAKNKAKILILGGLFLAALSFLFLVVTQKNFKASTDLLVVQNQNGFTDYYALSKSADFLTGVLTESIYSGRFLDEVNNAGVSTNFLPSNRLDRLKEWEKIVRINRNPNLGTMHIEVFGDNQKQVTDVSNAIVTVLTTKNFMFLGNGQDLDIRVLNSPSAEANPSLINIVLTVVGGFIVGALLVYMFLYYKAQGCALPEADARIESLQFLEK